METVLILAQFFFLQACLGIGFFTPLADSKMTGSGFIKLIMGICLGLGLAALVLLSNTHALLSPELILLIAALVFMGLTYCLHGEGKTPLTVGTYLGQVLCLVLSLAFSHNFVLKSLVFSLTSSLFLGVTVYGMLLGHWYLVTPKLSTRPLELVHMIFWSLLFFKLGQMGWELTVKRQLPQTGEGYAFDMLILSMRTLWGYLGLFAMGIFSWKLVKMRSLQSATGMLYAMTFFMLVGELMAGYIYFKTGFFF